MDPLVWLNGAGVSLGGQTALRDIDLTLKPSEVLGVVGPNGSGKTTLLRLIAALVPPRVGSGTVLGAALGTPEVYPVRRRIGLIGHSPSLIPELTIMENLVHAVRLAGLEPDRIVRALKVVGLEGASDRRFSACSHGMQRRTEIALILLRRPDLLLLDEPMSGLDEDAKGLVDALIGRVTGNGGGVVMVSHETSHLSSCHRILGLPGGAIEVDG